MISMNEQEQVDIPEFNLADFMGETYPLFGIEVYHWIIFIFIFLSLAFIYNSVFKPGKLPPLKLAVVYILLLIGAFMLLIFQVDGKLSIVYCLLVAFALMLIVRIRYWIQGKKDGTKE